MLFPGFQNFHRVVGVNPVQNFLNALAFFAQEQPGGMRLDLFDGVFDIFLSVALRRGLQIYETSRGANLLRLPA